MDLKPVIFCDVDGVCNIYPDSWRNMDDMVHGGPVERNLIEKIVVLAERAKAQIVVCSAWRAIHTRETFIEAFGKRLGEVLAPGDTWRTGNEGGLRGEEVAVWLDKNGWRPYVAIDDSTDYYMWQPVSYTDCMVGVTDEDISFARGLLVQQIVEGPWKRGMRYRFGDMLTAPFVIVAHGCNAQGAMGSGAALAVIQRYPKNKKTYQEFHRKNGLKLGQVVWHMDRDDELQMHRIIANCITQEFAGHDGKKYVDYPAIKTCLEQVADVALSNNWDGVAMCQIGAGLAGGDWAVILEIVESVGRDKGMTFMVYFPDATKYHDACGQYRGIAHERRKTISSTPRF